MQVFVSRADSPVKYAYFPRLNGYKISLAYLTPRGMVSDDLSTCDSLKVNGNSIWRFCGACWKWQDDKHDSSHQHMREVARAEQRGLDRFFSDYIYPAFTHLCTPVILRDGKCPAITDPIPWVAASLPRVSEWVGSQRNGPSLARRYEARYFSRQRSQALSDELDDVWPAFNGVPDNICTQITIEVQDRPTMCILLPWFSSTKYVQAVIFANIGHVPPRLKIRGRVWDDTRLMSDYGSVTHISTDGPLRRGAGPLDTDVFIEDQIFKDFSVLCDEPASCLKLDNA